MRVPGGDCPEPLQEPAQESTAKLAGSTAQSVAGLGSQKAILSPQGEKIKNK